MFQLVAAPAHELFRRIEGEKVAGLDAVAGFVGGLAVDANQAGQDEAFGLFPAVAQGAFDEGLIQTGHGHWLAKVRPKPVGKQCGLAEDDGALLPGDSMVPHGLLKGGIARVPFIRPVPPDSSKQKRCKSAHPAVASSLRWQALPASTSANL